MCSSDLTTRCPQLSQIRELVCTDRPAATRRAVYGRVVHDHEVIPAFSNVEFDAIGACSDCDANGCEGIFVDFSGGAAMSEYFHNEV